MTAQLFDFDAPLPARVYWDASFLVHATYPAGRYHRACYAFLERLNSTEATSSYVSSLTLDEAVFTLIQLKVIEEHPDRGFWDLYRGNPQVIRPHLAELRALLDRLSVDPRIRVVGTDAESMSGALDYMDRYALLPRDALHWTTMAQHGIDSIVTTDQDFVSVEELRIFTCNPTLLAQR